jgi:7-keto-8-aminopelargonate synthetase-like enzyme
LKALEILRREPERRERLWQTTRKLQEGLRASGFDIGGTCTPIVPVLVGDYRTVATFWRELFHDENVVVNAVVPPGVPAGSARLRVSLTADFTEDDAGRVVEAFVRVRERLAKRNHQDVSSILT